MKKKYIHIAALIILLLSFNNYMKGWKSATGPDLRFTFKCIIALVATLIYLVMVLIQKIKTRESTETIISEDKMKCAAAGLVFQIIINTVELLLKMW